MVTVFIPQLSFGCLGPWCETSVCPSPHCSDPPCPTTGEGGTETLWLDLTERGGCRPVILMEYGISKGSQVMFTQQTHHFLHVTSGRRYMRVRGGEKETRVDAASHRLPLPSNRHLSQLPVPIRLRLPLSPNLSPANYLSAPLDFIHTPALTLILAFKLSNC